MNFFIGLLLALHLHTGTQVQQLRKAYFDAAMDRSQLDGLKKQLDSYPARDHYFYCYLSAYNSLSSKYAGSISKKMEYFNLCKKNLDQSLQLKDSFDARFIRFCVQHNTPRLLGYKSELHTDKAFILKNLKTQANSEYKQKVKEFLRACDLLSAEEKAQLEKL